MDKAIFIPLIIWALFVVVTVLKKSLDASSRFLTLLVFVIYGFIFKDDVIRLVQMKKIPYMILIENFVDYVFLSLAILWPVVLIMTQKMTDYESSSIIARFAIFSAIAFAGFLYFN